MSQYRFLTVERDGGTVTCTLANPPHHTLVAPEVIELRHLIARLESDPDVRVVIFTGAREGVFIAHYDVGELAASSESQVWLPSPTDPMQLHDLHRLILAIRNSRLTTVAAVNGSTVGSPRPQGRPDTIWPAALPALALARCAPRSLVLEC